jgi:hypothetical protein
MKRQLRNSKGQFALASAEVTAIRDEMKSEMKSLEAMFSQQMANMMGMIQNLTLSGAPRSGATSVGADAMNPVGAGVEAQAEIQGQDQNQSNQGQINEPASPVINESTDDDSEDDTLSTTTLVRSAPLSNPAPSASSSAAPGLIPSIPNALSFSNHMTPAGNRQTVKPLQASPARSPPPAFLSPNFNSRFSYAPAPVPPDLEYPLRSIPPSLPKESYNISINATDTLKRNDSYFTYSNWRRRILTYLKDAKVMFVLNGYDAIALHLPSNDIRLTHFEEFDDRAQRIINAGIGSNFSIPLTINSAQELWDHITKLFQNSSYHAVTLCRQKIEVFRCPDPLQAKDKMAELELLIQEYETTGGVVSELDLLHYYRSSFTCIRHWLEVNRNATLEEIKEVILEKHAAAAFKSIHQVNEVKVAHSGIRCFDCGGNHFRANCPGASSQSNRGRGYGRGRGGAARGRGRGRGRGGRHGQQVATISTHTVSLAPTTASVSSPAPTTTNVVTMPSVPGSTPSVIKTSRAAIVSAMCDLDAVALECMELRANATKSQEFYECCDGSVLLDNGCGSSVSGRVSDFAPGTLTPLSSAVVVSGVSGIAGAVDATHFGIVEKQISPDVTLRYRAHYSPHIDGSYFALNDIVALGGDYHGYGDRKTMEMNIPVNEGQTLHLSVPYDAKTNAFYITPIRQVNSDIELIDADEHILRVCPALPTKMPTAEVQHSRWGHQSAKRIKASDPDGPTIPPQHSADCVTCVTTKQNRKPPANGPIIRSQLSGETLHFDVCGEDP